MLFAFYMDRIQTEVLCTFHCLVVRALIENVLLVGPIVQFFEIQEH